MGLIENAKGKYLPLFRVREINLLQKKSNCMHLFAKNKFKK